MDENKEFIPSLTLDPNATATATQVDTFDDAATSAAVRM